MNAPPRKPFFPLNHLSSKTQSHLKSTYGTLMILCVLAALGAYFFGQGQFSAFFVMLSFLSIIVFSLSSDQLYRYASLFSFAFANGATSGPLIHYAMGLDPFLPLIAFFSAAVVFASFSVFAMLSRRREYIYLGSTLSSLLTLLLFFSILQLFIPFPFLDQIELYGGLVIFSGYVIYDTQVIIERAEMGILDPLADSLRLFTDAIPLFLRILRILMDKEKKKKRERR